MSTTLDKTALVRLSWLTELRRQGDRKCVGRYHAESLVCALGLLAECAGVTVQNGGTCAADVGALAGLTQDQSFDISDRNDGTGGAHTPHTFAEIADVVASWFPNT